MLLLHLCCYLPLFFRIVALCCCRSSHMKEVRKLLSDSAASVCTPQNTYTMLFLTWKSRFRPGRWGLRERPSRRHLLLRHTLRHCHGGSLSTDRRRFDVQPLSIVVADWKKRKRLLLDTEENEFLCRFMRRILLWDQWNLSFLFFPFSTEVMIGLSFYPWKWDKSFEQIWIPCNFPSFMVIFLITFDLVFID